MNIYFRFTRRSYPLQQNTIFFPVTSQNIAQHLFLCLRQRVHFLHLLFRHLQTTDFSHNNLQHAPFTQSLQSRNRITDFLNKLRSRQTLYLMLVTIIHPITQHLVLCLCPFQTIKNPVQLFTRELSFPSHPTFNFGFEQIIHRLLDPDNFFFQQSSNSDIDILSLQEFFNFGHTHLASFSKNSHNLFLFPA